MKALVPFTKDPLAKFLQGLADYDNQDGGYGRKKVFSILLFTVPA